MRQPQVGEPIRFFAPDGSDRAAVVVGLVDGQTVDLLWFARYPFEQPLNQVWAVPFGPPNQPGCWHWLVGQC